MVSMRSCATTRNWRPVSKPGKSAYGCVRVKCTVASSGASTDFITSSWVRPGEPVAGSTMRWNENTTSLAVSGLPWWNFTPGRSLNVHSRRSADGVQLTARSGTTLELASMRVSPPNTSPLNTYSSPSVVTLGSRLFRLVDRATCSVDSARAAPARPTLKHSAASAAAIFPVLLIMHSPCVVCGRGRSQAAPFR
ncbi:Uncharacterised protein [Bordetella pertussis]|nr:Uncharacterised protein [Bordetella pertussis]